MEKSERNTAPAPRYGGRHKERPVAINWFPGHMNKARREIRKAMPQVDLIFEVLDARMPFSSENPLVNQLRGGTPCIKILNKRDLADPVQTAIWMSYLNAQPGITAITHERKQPKQSRALIKLGRRLMPPERNKTRAITAMILGVPNVGKSTLINTMAGRALARTSNVPAVTRRQQRVELSHDFILLDTPGFLWPRLDPPACGLRLALLGSIPDNVVEYQELAFFASAHLRDHYPEGLKERYKLNEIPSTNLELLNAIAAKRGCIAKGGVVDLQKVCELLVKELRAGMLGPITLESPGASPKPYSHPKEYEKRKYARR